VAGWVAIKAPFARQPLSLRTYASLTASGIAHEDVNRVAPARSGATIPNPTIPQIQRTQPVLSCENRDLRRSPVTQPLTDLVPRPTVQVKANDQPKFVGGSQSVNIQ
jgi:hypothetical protein